MIVLQDRRTPTPRLSRKSSATLELDFDLWHEHEVCRQEHQRRIETEPYIRLFCRRIAEISATATELKPSRQRLEAQIYLLSDECRGLWGLLLEAGALLFPYETFREKLLRYIREGRAIVFPSWWGMGDNSLGVGARRWARQSADPVFREKQRARQRRLYWEKKAGAA